MMIDILLNKVLLCALPNSCFIQFCGEPISLSDNNGTTSAVGHQQARKKRRLPATASSVKSVKRVRKGSGSRAHVKTVTPPPKPRLIPRSRIFYASSFARKVRLPTIEHLSHAPGGDNASAQGAAVQQKPPLKLSMARLLIADIFCGTKSSDTSDAGKKKAVTAPLSRQNSETSQSPAVSPRPGHGIQRNTLGAARMRKRRPVPRGLRSSIKPFAQLIRNWSTIRVQALLEKYCSRKSLHPKPKRAARAHASVPHHVAPTQSPDQLPSMGSYSESGSTSLGSQSLSDNESSQLPPKKTDSATLSFAEAIRQAHVDPRRVTKFLVAVVLQIVPSVFWGGDTNREQFCNSVQRFVHAGRYDQILLEDVLVQDHRGLATIFCGQNSRQPAANPRAKSIPLNAQQQKVLSRRVRDFYWWLWNSVIVPLTRATFYVTEVDGCANKVRTWNGVVATLLR